MEQLPAIDWDLAARTGASIVPAGPALGRSEIAAVVAELRSAAERANEHVADVTELAHPRPAEVLVVDRAGWLRAATSTARTVLAEAAGSSGSADNVLRRARAAALGVQVAGVLSVVATRVLGQFDPFRRPETLLLVAPNVVAVERSLGVLPSDFRLWVCLHEQTHRFQFGAAPWLREHLLGLVGELLDDELEYGWRRGEGGLTRVFGSPEQADAFAQANAVMALLEGHADVMMDRVGTSVVPTYPSIRRAFNARRESPGWFGQVQKLIGLDLKMAQYRDGAAFCRAIIEAADVATLNRAFSAPGMLPTAAELTDPQRWLHRV